MKLRLHVQGVAAGAAGGADEAPGAYKRLNEVLAEQGDSIKVLHTLSPRIACMAGPETHDPYKD